MKKTLWILAVVLLVIIVSNGIKQQKVSDKYVIKIGYLPIVASLPLYVAQENKYFEQENIAVETIQMQTSNQLVEALVRGDIDVIVETSAAPVLSAEVVDPDKIKIFSASDITQEQPFDKLLVNTGSTIKNPNGLAGKKIGVFPGSTATNLLKKWLTNRGLDVSKIEFIPIPPQNQLQALEAGSIDALHAYEPTIAITVTKNLAKTIHGSIYADLLNHNPQGVAVISQKFITEHPLLVKKVISVFDKATADINVNKENIRVDILPKYSKLDPEVAKNVVFLHMSESKNLNQDTLQKYADMLYELGELKIKLNISNMPYK